MIWTDDRTLVMESDGPANLHPWTLALALRDSVGDKPSIKSTQAVLLSVNFHDDLNGSAKSSVEAIVASHDGTAALADDAAVAAAKESNRAVKRAERATLGAKHRNRHDPEGAGPLSAPERAQAIDHLLDKFL